MTFFGKKGLGGNEAIAAAGDSDANSETNVWEELVSSHGRSDGAYAHNSRHAKSYAAGQVVGDVAEVVVATAILDTALNTQGSNANYRDALGIEDSESAHDLASGLGAGIVGSIFGA